MSQFAKVAAPLHALTGKGVAAKRYKPARLSDWSNEAQSAFESLKAGLCDAPILQYPRFDREFVLDVDASLKGLGACLSQVDDSGNLRPIAFASRGLRGAEKNYSDLSSFKLELLALKWAVTEKFKPYTLGAHSVVYTDHNPLAHLKTAKLGATEHRWVAQLAPFDMEVKYRPGSLNQCADALSRCPSNMSAGEAVTALHFAMDSTLVPQEVRDCHIQEVTVAELGVVEGLTPSVLPSYTLEQLSAMQKADNVLHHVWEMRLAGWEPGKSVPGDAAPGLLSWLKDWEQITERGGVLYRVSQDAVHGSVHQLLVPAALRTTLLQAVHDQWGHQGVGRTYALLKARCYWPGMNRDIRQHIRSCFPCAVAKRQTPAVRPPLRHLLAFRPNERLAIDFLKLDRGRGGYEDVLVMTDSFTKFAQAVPCKDQTAPVVAKALRDRWFACYGVPVQLHADQGRNFESDLVREICALYGIRKTRTSPYHPQGNGQTERFNATLCALVKSLGLAERRKWPDALPHLMLIYNTTPHSVTGISPYTLMFGRRPVLPVDQLINNTHQNWSDDFVQEQADLIGRAKAVAKDALHKAAAADKQRWDRRAFARPMAVGDRVLLKQCAFTGRHKLSNQYGELSYVVVQVNADQNMYEVRPALGGEPKWVNRKMLVLDPRDELPDEPIGLRALPETAFDEYEELDDVDPGYPAQELEDVDPGYTAQDQPLLPFRPIPKDVPNRRSTRSNRGHHTNPAHLPR